MARTRIIQAIAALQLLMGIAPSAVSDETDTTRSAALVAMPADEKHRGVSWVAGREITVRAIILLVIRRLLTVAIFLLLGAIVNVAVAWGCA